MSHTRVKTTFEESGDYGSTEIIEIFCHHNHSNDITSFYYKDGETVDMLFQEWTIDSQDKWDAVQRLWSPFKDKWGNELKDGVEFYNKDEIKVDYNNPNPDFHEQLRRLCAFQHWLGTNYTTLPTDSGEMTKRARLYHIELNKT